MSTQEASSNAAAPIARGRLSTTSLAELLVLALERRLNGSFVFETPVRDKSALVVAAGRVTKVLTAEPVEPLGRLLTESGVIDRDMLEQALRLARERNDRLGDALIAQGALNRGLLERTLREQLGRRLHWLGQLPEESAYGFYANVDLLDDRPECGADPLALIWRCMRDARGPHRRQDAALAALGAHPLRLTSRAMLDRFELSPGERACFESLRARPLTLDLVLELSGVESVRARRSVYALLLTRQLEPLPTLPNDASAASASVPPGPSVRSSSVPPAPDRVEHALERASRLVRERTRAEQAVEAAGAIELARASIARKQHVEAEALVRKACALDPSNAEYVALHAWVRVQNGELGVPALAAQIVAALDRAVMKAPANVAVRFQRAQVLKRLGRDDAAYRDFRFVARRDPERIDAVREVRLHRMRTREKPKQSGVFSKLFLR